MKKFVAFALGAAAALSGLPGAARATVLYDQPYVYNADRGPFSELDSQQIVDNFQVPVNGVAAAAYWWGSYLTGSTDPWNSGDLVQFHVRFFLKDNGTGLPQQTAFYDAAVAAAVTDTGLNEEGFRIYRFDAAFAPVALTGGTPYYFSALESDARTNANDFRWANSASGGADEHYFRGGNSGGWSVEGAGSPRANDAFTLLTPEPASLLLLALGGFALRRR